MINLLPSFAKKELRAQERMRLLIILLYSVFGAVLCFTLALASLQIFMENRLQESRFPLDSAKEELARKSVSLQSIEQFNWQVNSLSAFFQKRASQTAVLERLASLKPEGIVFSVFSYTAPTVVAVGDQQRQDPAKISVSGFAPTRDVLLEFREHLQNDSSFQNVQFPPSNWVSPFDITFSFTASLQ